MNGIDLQKIRLFKDQQKQIGELKHLLSLMKSRMTECLNEIEDQEKQKFSGQWALFKVDQDGKYSCTGVMNETSAEQDDNIMRDVVLVLPLPDHTSLKEFDGF